MSTSGRRSLGTWVLVVGWIVVASGAVLIVVALGNHSPSRNEHAGVGFALLMSGMLVVLAGNYIHHRALVDDDRSGQGQDRDGRPGPEHRG